MRQGADNKARAISNPTSLQICIFGIVTCLLGSWLYANALPLSPSISDHMPVAVPAPSADPVILLKKGSHYEVLLDFSHTSHRQVGREYALKIQKAIPGFEQLIDAYLFELADHNWLQYEVLLHRAGELKERIPAEIRQEIEGMSEAFSRGMWSLPGDGTLSVDEIYLLNLLPDVGRETQCSALAVLGSRSSTGATIAGRNLDWPDGSRHQISRLQAIMTYKKNHRSIVSIGCLGFQGILSGFNDQGVFASVLDSPSGARFSSEGCRSYPMDLRESLQKCATAAEVGKDMSDGRKNYCFNHLIFLADAQTAGVLENNFSGGRNTFHRWIRGARSKLNPGIDWGIDNAVAATNAFLLAGNDDNFNDGPHALRFHNLRKQLLAAGPVVDATGMERIMSFHYGDRPGDPEVGNIYNTDTLQSMIFEPQTKSLHIFFRPRSGILPSRPVFETIKPNL